MSDNDEAPAILATINPEEHFGLACYIVQRCRHWWECFGLDYEELCQEARMALFLATPAYRPTMGVSFSRYAFRKIQRRLRLIILKAQRRIKLRTVGLPEGPYGETFDPPARPEVVPNDPAPIKQAVARLLPVLSDRQAQVVRWYFGLDGCERLDTVQIAERTGVTRQAVSDVLNNALKALKNAADKLGIRADALLD